MFAYSHLPMLAAGVGSTALVFLVLRSMSRTDHRVLQRIRDLEGQAPASPAVPGARSRVTRSSLFHRLFSPKRAEAHGELRGRLLQAGFYSAAAVPVFNALQCLGAVLLGALAIIVARWLSPRSDILLPALIGACSGFLCPSLLLRRFSLKRLRMFERAIPDFLDLLTACLDAGLSLEGAIQKITGEIQTVHPVLGSELQRVQRDIDLGATPDRAIQSFSERSNLDVVRTLATACSQSRRYGSKLTQTLRTLADSLRQQREQRAEEAAQAAAVKILFPTLVLLFPIIFVVLAGPAVIQITEQFAQAGMSNGR